MGRGLASSLDIYLYKNLTKLGGEVHIQMVQETCDFLRCSKANFLKGSYANDILLSFIASAAKQHVCIHFCGS